MEREERQQLRAITEEVGGWIQRANAVLAHRTSIEKAGSAAADNLRAGVIDVRSSGGPVDWKVLPLRSVNGRQLADVARSAQLPTVSRAEAAVLRHLTVETAAAARDVKSAVGARRLVARSKKRKAGADAAQFLPKFREWALTLDLPGLLDRLGRTDEGRSVDVPISDALAEWVGFAERVKDLGRSPELVASAVVANLPQQVKDIQGALHEEVRVRSNVLTAGEAVRATEVEKLISDMPVERLKEATRDRIRIGPLTDAGVTTVREVLEWGPMLEDFPGIGATTATRMLGAARALWQATHDEMPVRIDIQERTPEATELLHRLSAWDSVRTIKTATTDLARADALTPLAYALDSKVSHLVVFPGASPVTSFHESTAAVGRRARELSTATQPPSFVDPWEDFMARPADYFAMLSELGFFTDDEEKAHGDLPDDIVEAVRRVELETEHLSASLRGYQSFGARFALVQRKVIIGDEMGLGKTVEALAVLAHLRSRGSHHFLVVCPAAVVTNWIREVSSKSALSPHRIHGPGRDLAARNWVRNGGVAVTTFETLSWFENQVADVNDLGCVVIDEAHYIKNPVALRTQRAARVLNSCDRAILLTGTPLENRIEEFANLVSYLRPDLVIDANEIAPRRFRRQVAPAYLRRNQEDVLTELPELVEVDEWLPMSAEDAAHYRAAVAAGNFMAMRQAAMRDGKRSQKLQRLVEIVAEAEDNSRRVIVFSHFRAVLDQVTQALPGRVFGPLTGSVPAVARQMMVDQFSSAGHGAVLVSQIVAGGVGLNIQAASVVVICEPQLKPTTEWQAIARAHRMGQLESVQVHRLLSEEGVDQRVTEILARKRELFEEFARISETAGSAPEALDVSEADLARDVIEAERERLFAHEQQESPKVAPIADDA